MKIDNYVFNFGNAVAALGTAVSFYGVGNAAYSFVNRVESVDGLAKILIGLGISSVGFIIQGSLDETRELFDRLERGEDLFGNSEELK